MLPIKHSVLIVENNQTLFIVDNNENKSTIEQILETPISTDDDPKIKEEQPSDIEDDLKQTDEADIDNFTLEEKFFNEDTPKNLEDSNVKYDKIEVKSLNCKYCDVAHKTLKKLKKHICPFQDASNPNTFICKVSTCNKQLSKKSFDYHMSTHSVSESKVICDYCNKKFNNLRLLSLHQTVHTGARPNKCEHCEYKALTRQQLVRHMASHGVPAPMYTCQICQKQFSYKHYLTLHERMHNNTSFECKLCNRQFERKDYLKEHYVTAHTDGQKNFKCNVCFKEFALKKYLKRHLTIHSEKPKNFECNVCGKLLSHKKQLENHIMVHTNVRKNICQNCGKSFITLSALTNHMYKHTPHPAEPTKKCPITNCDKTFSRLTDIKRHLTTAHHQKPHACQYCDKTYLHKNQLVRHMCLHTGEKVPIFKCNICFKELTQQYYLNQHILAKHGGALNFFCQLCQKGFVAQQQLTRHMKTCSLKSKKKLDNDLKQQQTISMESTATEQHFNSNSILVHEVVIQPYCSQGN